MHKYREKLPPLVLSGVILLSRATMLLYIVDRVLANLELWNELEQVLEDFNVLSCYT